MSSYNDTLKTRKALYYKVLKKKKEKKILFNLFRLVLAFALLVCLCSSLISYGAVMNKSMELHKLHDNTHLLLMENNEVKLDVETSSSLYQVNKKEKLLTNLHKPAKIIEIQLKNKNNKIKLEKLQPLSKMRVVVGY